MEYDLNFRTFRRPGAGTQDRESGVPRSVERHLTHAVISGTVHPAAE